MTIPPFCPYCGVPFDPKRHFCSGLQDACVDAIKTALWPSAPTPEVQTWAARYAKLAAVAQAVIDRWDTPLWKDVPATGEYINRLRAVLREQA